MNWFAEIRDITKGDEKWVKEIFEKHAYTLGPFGMAWYRYWQLKEENPKAGELWVGIENIAFCHYRVRRNKRRTIYEIAVVDGYKGQGIGKAILNYVGYPIDLKTDIDNPISNGFYNKYGFKLTGTGQSKNGSKKFNYYSK